LHGFWERYRKEFEYAKDIAFADTCKAALALMDKAMSASV
jgi:hypothetical protein